MRKRMNEFLMKKLKEAKMEMEEARKETEEARKETEEVQEKLKRTKKRLEEVERERDEERRGRKAAEGEIGMWQAEADLAEASAATTREDVEAALQADQVRFLEYLVLC